MNELSVIGSLYLRTNLWDRHGKNIATRHKGNVWRKVAPTSEKTILMRDFRFFAALLSEMDLDNADTREA